MKRLLTALLCFSISLTTVVSNNTAFESLWKSRPKPNSQPVEDARSGKDVQGGIGLVDFQLCLLFHPSMRVYNFKIHNVFRPVPTNLTVPLNFYLEERERKSIRMVREAQSSRVRNQLELERLRKQYDQETRNYNSKKRELMNSGYTDIEKDLEELRKVKEENQRKIQAEILKVNEETKKIYNESFGIHYLTMEEREAFLQKVVEDVREVIDAIREKKSYSFILNSRSAGSYDLRRITPSSYFQQGQVQMNSLWKFLRRPQRLKSGEDNNVKLEAEMSEMAPFFERLSDVSKIFQGSAVSQFVLSGGEDLTYDVLKNLYRKYNYKEPQIQRLLMVVRALREEDS